MPRRIFISTGEVSGDLQGSLLVSALVRQGLARGWDLEITALGGERMAAAGATLLADTTGLGSVGLLEAVAYLWPSWKIQRRTRHYLDQNPPDGVVLIDYMGPNLSLGQFVGQRFPQMPLLYYIAPQEWVWSFGNSNTSKIAKVAQEILAIFPGEADYYRQQGATVRWVGHPLLDRLEHCADRPTARAALGIPPEQTAIALLPASRFQELKYVLPVIFGAAQRLQAQLPQVHFWIPLSQAGFKEPLLEAIAAYGLQASLWTGDSTTVLGAVDLAITKSGTVNLELALQNTPQVVVYRLSRLTAWIAQYLLRFSIPFASPPNLVLQREVVPELIQGAATVERITQAALDLLQNPQRRSQMLADYGELRSALGEVGVCDRAAQIILDALPEPRS